MDSFGGPNQQADGRVGVSRALRPVCFWPPLIVHKFTASSSPGIRDIKVEAAGVVQVLDFDRVDPNYTRYLVERFFAREAAEDRAARYASPKLAPRVLGWFGTAPFFVLKSDYGYIVRSRAEMAADRMRLDWLFAICITHNPGSRA